MATLALTLGGCGGAGDQDADDVPELPFDRYAAALFPDADADAMARQMTTTEELVARCMHDLGFDYVPVDYSSSGSSTTALDVEWGSVEFAEQYGYGVTTDAWGDPLADADVDYPNQERVEAMSENERAAYGTALWGEQSFGPDADPDTFDDYSWEQSGCQGEAQHEVELNAAAQDELAAGLQEDLGAMWEALSTDPRLIELYGAWSSCMADAGFPGLSTVADAQLSIIEKANAVYDGTSAGATGEAGATGDAEVDATIEEGLAALTPIEIETAVADATCQAEVGYDDAEWAVNDDYQQRFVDAHRADLDALLAAFEEANG
jgi:hypothetical protein